MSQNQLDELLIQMHNRFNELETRLDSIDSEIDEVRLIMSDFEMALSQVALDYKEMLI